MRQTPQIAILLLILANTPLFGQVEAKITAPERAELGDLIILDGSASKGATAYEWRLVGSTKTFLPVDGGQRAVFASGTSGDYYFVLAVGGLNAAKPAISLATHKLTIGKGPQPPNPPPDVPDPPGPTPTIPEGYGGLTRFVYDQAILQIPAAQKGKCQSLADNFQGVSAAAAAGGFQDVPAANLDLKNKNTTTIGGDREALLPFFTELNKKLLALNGANKINNLQQLSQAYKAIADGLRLVKIAAEFGVSNPGE